MPYFQAVLIFLLIAPMPACQSAKPRPRQLDAVVIEQTNFQEVHFSNAEQGLDLAGMLFLPQGQGPFPAAAIIHGSGTSTRSNGWYLTLATYLQDNHIAVLLPDKRGSERSEGDWRTASFEDLASDTIAAIEFLRGNSQIDASRVGAIGLSQGGHFVPLVANRAADLAFVVNMVGSAVPMHAGLIYEEKHNLREAGVPGLFANFLAYPSAWSIIYLRQRKFWNAIGNFDPLPHWNKVSRPALVLYGENDTNVSSAESVALLNSLDNPNITVNLYQNSGHALESPPGEGNSIIREDALRDIAQFIHAAVTQN